MNWVITQRWATLSKSTTGSPSLRAAQLPPANPVQRVLMLLGPRMEVGVLVARLSDQT